MNQIVDIFNPKQGFKIALSLNLIIFILVGGIIIFFQKKVDTVSALLLSIACLGLGGIVGFLFGIPKVFQNDSFVQENGKATSNEYKYVQKVNTNLEQISDWLTKIIVGLGLINLYKIPDLLSETSTIISKSISTVKNYQEVQVFSNSLIIYFPCLGFFAGYLITRIILSPEFKRADIKSISIGNEEIFIDDALKSVINNISTNLSENVSENKNVLKTNYKSILWVDDNPQNNIIETEAFRKMGIEVIHSTSTKDALNILNTKNNFDIIISDMNRVEDFVSQQNAGIVLLKELKKNQINIDTYIYCSKNNAIKYFDIAKQEGAKGIFSSSNELFNAIFNQA